MVTEREENPARIKAVLKNSRCDGLIFLTKTHHYIIVNKRN